MIKLDISSGVEPLIAWNDMRERRYMFWVDGKSYEFDEPLPFTLKDGCADKELVIKHGAAR